MASGILARSWWLMLVAATAASQKQQNGLLQEVMSGLRRLPVIGNVLRASVHPIYRPFIKQFQSRIKSREGEDELTELCFEELGCLFTHEDFFHPIHRPLNLPPNTREEIHVVFTVHSRDDSLGTALEATNVTRVLDTSFNPIRKTKVIIHGYLETNTETWMWDMVRALLQYEDFNVVTVDWSGGSQALYSQATANTRVVGLEVAHFINWLKDNIGLDPRDVHIIGHSLGSHTAGYAGERVPGLGRITGLDPAEPYFQYMSASVRLDPSDALFVDVIHTDADSIFYLGAGYGLRQPVGHLDFYPNDGRSQPGCDSLSRVPLTALTDGLSLYEGLDAAQKELVACNHFRAPKLFTDSILTSCPYTAFHCSSYPRYLKGKCTSCGEDGSGCAHLGLRADQWAAGNQSLVTVYLSTAGPPNYCLYHYQLVLQLADPEGIGGSLRGKLKISFFADDGSIRHFDISPEAARTFVRGRTYSFFLYHHEDLSSASEALVQWTYEADMFNPLSYCVLFCDTSLPLTRLTFTSVDHQAAGGVEAKTRGGASGKAVMCHQQGLSVVRVASGTTVKVVSSPACHKVPTPEGAITPRHNLTSKLLGAGLASLSSLFNLNLIRR